MAKSSDSSANRPNGASYDPDKTEIRKDRVRSPDLDALEEVEPIDDRLGATVDAPKQTESLEPTSPSSNPKKTDDVHALVGSLLDHYRIESLVGVGGMGAVYRGRDQRLDRIVAIKVVPISHRKAEAMRRFRIEAQSAAKLDHPNIARVYYVGETEEWSYIVFEFIEGINLRQLVLDRGPLSVDDATHFTCQVAEALQHSSERGVVHRDIKPSNILLATDGKAKVVDMGLARTTALDRSSADQTASGTTLGTFDYISPEQAQDPRDADVRSDIYSLGCTLYFLLTGQPPFPDGTALQKLLMHGTKTPEDPRIFREDLSDALIAILRKMMAKKPRDRYQVPEDLASDLRMLAKLDNLAWSSSLAESTFINPQSRRTWFEALAPLVLCVSIIGIVTLWLVNANQIDAVFPIPRVAIENASLANAPPKENPTDLSNSGTGGNESALPIASQTNSSRFQAKDSKSNSQLEPNTTYILVHDDKENPNPRLPEGISLDDFRSHRTLDDALAEAAAVTGSCRIWLANDCVQLRRWRATSPELATSLLIQSTPGNRFQIIFDESAAAIKSGETSTWFQVDGGQIAFNDIDLYWRPLIATSQPKALVSARGGGRCSLENSTLTVECATTNLLPSVFQLEHDAKDGVNASGASGTSNSTSPPPRFLDLRILDSAVRGECDFVQTHPSERLEVRVRNAWFGIAGSMVVSQALRTVNRSPRVRVEISDSTCITLKPWLRVDLSSSYPYPVAIVRVANQSIFAGAKALVEWDATDCTDWVFANQAKKLEDLGRWIDFRGLDNAYDASSIEHLVHVQMSMSSEELQIDSDTNLLKNEMGMEVIGVWSQRPGWDPLKMHDLKPIPIPPGTIGFDIGASLENIPSFPVH